MAEQTTHNRLVVGSSPTSSTIGRMAERLNATVLKTVKLKGFLGSNPSPSAIWTVGRVVMQRITNPYNLDKLRRFKSYTVRQATIAQLAEQLICNQQVKGSSPFGSSTEI